MPEAAVFEVRCRGCGCSVLCVDRIRDPEIAILQDHLRACAASEPLGKVPMLGEITRRLNIAALKF